MKKLIILGLCVVSFAGVMALTRANMATSNGVVESDTLPKKSVQKGNVQVINDMFSAKSDDGTIDEPIVDESEECISEEPAGPKVRATFPCKMKSYVKNYGNVKKVYNVADIDDSAWVYRPDAKKENCFIVISKQEFRLYVYEVVGKDTLIVAHYPVCYGKNAENKTKTGDRCTPESSMAAPFYISNIQDYSARRHDFGDGRGSILSYGHWFMRLDLSHSKNTASVRSNTTIGIHGSTNNVPSVPGRDSEGCIRLHDKDIIHLKDHFAYKGMKVVVKPANKGKLPFEINAEKKCKDYHFALTGYAEHN